MIFGNKDHWEQIANNDAHDVGHGTAHSSDRVLLLFEPILGEQCRWIDYPWGRSRDEELASQAEVKVDVDQASQPAADGWEANAEKSTPSQPKLVNKAHSGEEEEDE